MRRPTVGRRAPSTTGPTPFRLGVATQVCIKQGFCSQRLAVTRTAYSRNNGSGSHYRGLSVKGRHGPKQPVGLYCRTGRPAMVPVSEGLGIKQVNVPPTLVLSVSRDGRKGIACLTSTRVTVVGGLKHVFSRENRQPDGLGNGGPRPKRGRRGGRQAGSATMAPFTPDIDYSDVSYSYGDEGIAQVTVRNVFSGDAFLLDAHTRRFYGDATCGSPLVVTTFVIKNRIRISTGS